MVIETRDMDRFSIAADGIRRIAADDALKEQALKYLQQWLTDPQFAAYTPAAY
jgi:hypothetical protein